MNKFFVIKAVSFVLFLPLLLFSETVLTFPINSKKNTSFNITIPSEFHEAWKTPNGKMVEYLPQNETFENWSQIITVEVIPNQPSMLDFYLRKHKIAIEMLFATNELFKSEISFHKENGIKMGYAHYKNFHYVVESQTIDPSFMESMGMKVCQGKSALYRVAYNIKYPKDLHSKPFEEKIQSFLDQCSVEKASK